MSLSTVKKRWTKPKLTIKQENTIAASKKNNFTYIEKNKHRLTADDLNVKDLAGNTALYYAVTGSHYETANLLLKMGANVNSSNEFGNTPMHKALLVGNHMIINLLFSCGADLSKLNNFR